jgi:hypothetical protein
MPSRLVMLNCSLNDASIRNSDRPDADRSRGAANVCYGELGMTGPGETESADSSSVATAGARCFVVRSGPPPEESGE